MLANTVSFTHLTLYSVAVNCMMEFLLRNADKYGYRCITKRRNDTFSLVKYLIYGSERECHCRGILAIEDAVYDKLTS